MKQSTDKNKKVQAVRDATIFLFHKHYCENDVEAIIELFDDKLSWIGAGENEYDAGTEKISGIFRQFAGMVPPCNIWNEEYHVIDISPRRTYTFAPAEHGLPPIPPPAFICAYISV